jgi:hypothetical protein
LFERGFDPCCVVVYIESCFDATKVKILWSWFYLLVTYFKRSSNYLSTACFGKVQSCPCTIKGLGLFDESNYPSQKVEKFKCWGGDRVDTDIQLTITPSPALVMKTIWPSHL